MKDVFQSEAVTVSVSWLPSNFDDDSSNAEDRSLTLVSKSKDIRFGWSVSLETSMVCGDMNVRGRREDPIIASTVVLLRFLTCIDDERAATTVFSNGFDWKRKV